jgi:hypothetical protein
MRISFYVWILAVIGLTGCSFHPHDFSSPIRGNISPERVLSWLPADTETLLVANGPFWMSNFQIGGDIDKNRVVTHEEFEKNFQSATLALFVGENQLLEKHLRGKKILFALEASRHFRPPTGLGEAPFEGCAIAIFRNDLDDQRDAFLKEAANSGVRTEEVEGQKVVVFTERSEEDVWQYFVAFPQKGVVLAATNEQFLSGVLSRMRQRGLTRVALPAALPEWKYVNTSAQFWGIRHFDPSQSKYDPTSPFGGRKSGNIPDDGAIGLTYQCSALGELGATLTYLSSSDAPQIYEVEERRFPSEADPDDTAGLRIQRQILASGIIQSTYDLSRSQPLSLFMFVLMGNMGHVVYV